MADSKPERSTAERLRALIAEAGLTDIQVAERAGLHQQALSRLVTGAVPDPRLSTIHKVLKAIGKDWCDFEKA